MKNIELIENFPLEILENLPLDGNRLKSNNMIYSIVIDDYFIKILNKHKIKSLYAGNYFKLWRAYYEQIEKIIDVNKIYGLIELPDGRYVEVSKKLDKSKFLDMGSYSSQKWNVMLELYKKIYIYINDVISFQSHSDIMIGLESAIWNFNTDGKLFDIDPPRILLKNEDSSFTTLNDINHQKRTIYRNFYGLGMKLNLISTFMLGLKDYNFIIEDLPLNYKEILLDLLYENISLQDKKIIENYIGNLEESMSLFDGHPLKILKKLYNGSNI